MTKSMNQNHVMITIDQEVEIMMTKMKHSPKLLQKSASNSSCCIFRVPQSLVELNKNAYQPRIVSIGPYHYGNKDLEIIQEHKWRFLNDMITRTGKPLGVLMKSIVLKENEIRESYSESLDRFSITDLAKMMVLDGVFLIELFRKGVKCITPHQDDPIFKMGWISPFLMRDLLMIENQIPFFVLQKLFEASEPDTHTLQSLVLEFFNHAVDRRPEVLKKYEKLEGKHLLDFLRKSFISTKKRNSDLPKKVIPPACAHTTGEVNLNASHKAHNFLDIVRDRFKFINRMKRNRVVPEEEEDKTNYLSFKPVSPASELITAGVKLKANHEAESFLDIEFQNGLLSIPVINMDDFYSSFFMNCMVFEQCYFYCSKYITTYVTFMGFLMNNSIDVNFLLRNKIIENYFGADQDIAKFFKEIGKDVAFDSKNHYLLALFEEVNGYCNNGLHVVWAGFMHTYFESPWASISAFAAFTLLCLTVIQTFYTVFS